MLYFVFFFKQNTAYEMRISDWSSDVCSSDLQNLARRDAALFAGERLRFPKELKDDDAGHDEGRHLTLACYGMLPATRITDVLSQVERWTGFTQHFGHVSTGLPPGDEQAFLATLIAEATNLGLSRMAEVCGAGSRRALLRMQTWHM